MPYTDNKNTNISKEVLKCMETERLKCADIFKEALSVQRSLG